MGLRAKCLRCGEANNEPTATACRFCNSELPPLPDAALAALKEKEWSRRAAQVSLATMIGLAALVGFLMANYKVREGAAEADVVQTFVPAPPLPPTPEEIAAKRMRAIAAARAFLAAPDRNLNAGIDKCEEEIAEVLSNKLSHMKVGSAIDAIEGAKASAMYDLSAVPDRNLPEERAIRLEVCSFASTPLGQDVRRHRMDCRFEGGRYLGLVADPAGEPVPEGLAYTCDGLGF